MADMEIRGDLITHDKLNIVLDSEMNRSFQADLADFTLRAALNDDRDPGDDNPNSDFSLLRPNKPSSGGGLVLDLGRHAMSGARF